MCTLIISIGQSARWPLIVAANRDERLDRPAGALRLWNSESPRVLAPVDEQAHGTWLGLNAAGHFSALTNRFMARVDPARRSRGQLVLEALRAADPADFHRELQSRADTFNAFHLFSHDGAQGFVSWNESGFETQRLSAGLHVVTERSFSQHADERAEFIADTWHSVTTDNEGAPTPEALFELLTHVRVSIPLLDYGTRSALVLFRGRTLADSRLFESAGPPTPSSFIDHSGLLASLAVQKEGSS